MGDLERRERGQITKKDESRLTRNKDKMDAAARNASSAHVRAVDALQLCCSRHDSLCGLAGRIISSASSALREAVAGAAHSATEYPASCSPFAEEAANPPQAYSRTSTAGGYPQQSVYRNDVKGTARGAASTETSDVYNPFSEDVPVPEGGVASERCTAAPADSNPFDTADATTSEGCNPFSDAGSPAADMGADTSTSDGYNPFAEEALASEEGAASEACAGIASGVAASSPSNAYNPFAEDPAAPEGMKAGCEYVSADASVAHGASHEVFADASAARGSSREEGLDAYSLDAILSAAPGAAQGHCNPFGEDQGSENSRFDSAYGWK